MFNRLFAESGLSLERLRALVEVGAAGSIVRAAGSDTVRQSQYSRQIKELEDFFQAGLVERHGKGIRLTSAGRELARISRFFLMGLSNFQRGCLAEGQFYRIAGPPTFLQEFLVPVLAAQRVAEPGIRFAAEGATEEDIERRLHELTLDFAITTRSALSRPLQVNRLGEWRVTLWVPRSLTGSKREAARALEARGLPLAWPTGELALDLFRELENYEPAVTCRDFLQARALLSTRAYAAVLPGYFSPGLEHNHLLEVGVPWLKDRVFQYWLAWNPRLMRLNPYSPRYREALARALARKLAGSG